MSATRRALVVDDSRSARVILSRLLEIYGMQVDTAESGEQALEYVTDMRPDVIFMDHLMPGMDGFEAVRALKANPATQAIPVMMYSSQDGPEYLREALTCGAVGVLPKTLTQTDVSRALYQLRLLPDRREAQAPPRIADTPAAHPASFSSQATPQSQAPYAQSQEPLRLRSRQHQPRSQEQPQESFQAPSPSPSPSQAQPEVRAAVASMLKTYDADLRHALHSEFEAMTQRLLESQRSALRAEATHTSLPQESADAPMQPPWNAPARTSRYAQWVAGLMTVAFCALGWYAIKQYELQLQLQKNNADMAVMLQEQRRQIEALRGELMERSATPAIDTLPVPYGEAPLSGARIAAIRDRILALQSSGFKGTVQIDTYVGDFCLSGSAVTGYAVARDELPIRRCDAIGNPFEDGLAAEPPPQEFTNMVAMVTRNGTLPPQVKVAANGRMPAQRYPEQTATNAETLTASAWNKIAALNNRVEITLVQSTAL